MKFNDKLFSILRKKIRILRQDFKFFVKTQENL